MSTEPHPLCPESVCEHNLALNRALTRMTNNADLKRWKLAKIVLASVAIGALAVYAIAEGADPTSIALLAIVAIAALNGVELTELLAVWAEVKTELDDRDEEE